jgi:HAD superfamily hydrolase (TIGR01484 family)
MRYHILAADYDGTLAHHGIVADATVAALERLRQSGRRLLLLTGRQLPELLEIFPRADLFDRIVAENGALLYRPATREEVPLAEPPPEKFIELLKRQQVDPLAVGRVIVATWEPHQNVVLEAIRALGLELHVIFNKGAVMVLPSGINKATGLGAALAEMGFSAHNVVGVGDAENDHAFLSLCECSVATANAVEMLKERADWVASERNGAGVAELIDRLVKSDLKDVQPSLQRHDIPIGTTREGETLTLPAYGENVLIAGTSGGGKSTFVSGLLEQFAARNYQFCVIDPESDYEQSHEAVASGTPQQPPDIAQIMKLLHQPQQNAVINLLGVSLEDRPHFLQKLLPQLQEMRARLGRPHWIVIDEGHHMLPAAWDKAALTIPQQSQGIILVTVHPDHVSPVVLSAFETVIAIGDSANETIRRLSSALQEEPPDLPQVQLVSGEALLWLKRSPGQPVVFRCLPGSPERLRHRRKYAEGELGEDRSFYFRGPENRLNLRAHNLTLFTQMAKGLDPETWLFHLKNGDYSRWFRDAIKDAELAEEAAAIEEQPDISAEESRQRIEDAVVKRYTAPA